MINTKCEELAFPVLFPEGRFGYTYDREIKWTSVKYFNARLLHMLSINIALKKGHAQAITASQGKSDVNRLKGMI